MGFKENLKSELNYKGMLVKELAQKTGISKHTLDNYLNVREIIPTLDIAIKIAKALNVSVEYLATGEETLHNYEAISHDKAKLMHNYNLLNENDRKIVIEHIQLLLKHHRNKNKPQ